MIELLLVLLNYFWLSNDPEESASWYCDQHCFKIGSEVVESVWDAASMISPDLMDKATKAGIGMTYRHRRHAKEGRLWHPLSVWHALSRENMRRGLLNAKAIFDEHHRRTGKLHSALKDWEFLSFKVEELDFDSERWQEWAEVQNGSSSNAKLHIARRAWWKTYAKSGRSSIYNVVRNECKMSPPPFMGFEECYIKGKVVASYRKYYDAKIDTIKGGMRYYYTKPPKWLRKDPSIKTKRKGK
jgi:hypothetical protein